MRFNEDHISNEMLLDRFYATRDQKWLGILLERFTLLLFGVCLKYLKDEARAEDVVQQVFLKALAEIPRQQINNIGGWLYQVCRNECFSELRQSGRLVADGAMAHLESSPPVDLDRLLRQEAREHQLLHALEQLKPEQRQCIRLFYFEKESYQAIATQLQLSVKQVKSHIQNGKRNLKNILCSSSVFSKNRSAHE